MHRCRNSLLLIMALLLPACGLLETRPVPMPIPAPTQAPTATRRAPALTPLPTAAPRVPALTPIPTAPRHALALTPDNATGVVELARYGRGVAREIAWSADSQTLLLVAATGIYEYGAHDLAPKRYRELPLGTHEMVVSPDGRFAAMAISETAVSLLDLDHPSRPARLLEGLWAFDLAFSPDGRQLAACGWNEKHNGGLALVWDSDTGQVAARLEEDRRWSVENIAFSPDGRRLVATGRNTAETATLARVWDLATAKTVLSFEIERWTSGEMTFSPDGNLLLLGSLRWDAATGESLSPIGDEYTRTIYSPDGRWAAITSCEHLTGNRNVNRVCVWDAGKAGEGEPRWQADVDYSSVDQLTFSPDGRVLAALVGNYWAWGYSDALQAWDVETGTSIGTLQWQEYGVESLSISPDNHTAAWSNPNGLVQVWDLTTGTQLNTVTGEVQVVAYSPAGQLAINSRDALALWDGAGSEKLLELQPQEYPGDSLAFSPDGRLLVGTNDGYDITVWDMTTGTKRAPVKGHTSSVIDSAFSADGSFFATASNDATVRIWDAESLRVLQTFTTVERSGYFGFSVAVSADGHTVAGGTSEGGLWIWDTRSGQLVRTLMGHTNDVRALAYSPDGRLLASGDDDGHIYLWDSTGSAPLKLLAGHAGAVSTLAFTPDGRWLVSASRDGTVRIWGVKP